MTYLMIGLVIGSNSAPESAPVELGKIPWLRNYDEALALARKTGKPLLLLFQEVPG